MEIEIVSFADNELSDEEVHQHLEYCAKILGRVLVEPMKENPEKKPGCSVFVRLPCFPERTYKPLQFVALKMGVLYKIFMPF